MGKFAAELPASQMDIREAAEMMKRTMDMMAGASELPVTRVTVPSGGGKYFNMGDDVPPTAVIEGVIVESRFGNVYWDKPMGEGDATPACESKNGLSGWYMQDGELMERSCKTCPMNIKGSAGGGKRSKACKNIAILRMLVDGQALPVEVKVPTMSVGNYSYYLAREIVPRGLEIWQVTTKLTLRDAVNSGGIKYSQIAFECTGRVDDQEIMMLRGAVQPMLPGGEEASAE
jgi:hypothetical protein